RRPGQGRGATSILVLLLPCYISLLSLKYCSTSAAITESDFIMASCSISSVMFHFSVQYSRSIFWLTSILDLSLYSVFSKSSLMIFLLKITPLGNFVCQDFLKN